MTLSITTLSHNAECRSCSVSHFIYCYAECHNADCHYYEFCYAEFCTVMPSVIIRDAILLSVVAPNRENENYAKVCFKEENIHGLC